MIIISEKDAKPLPSPPPSPPPFYPSQFNSPTTMPIRSGPYRSSAEPGPSTSGPPPYQLESEFGLMSLSSPTVSNPFPASSQSTSTLVADSFAPPSHKFSGSSRSYSTITASSTDWGDAADTYTPYAKEPRARPHSELGRRSSSSDDEATVGPPQRGTAPPTPSSSTPYHFPEALYATPIGKQKRDKDKHGLPGCFFRQPQLGGIQTDNSSFLPMFLIPNKNKLRDGFPVVPPPSRSRPHPFATHDVREKDWKRFIVEMRKAATLTAGQVTTGILIPYSLYIPGASDYLSYKLRNKMWDDNALSVAGVVDIWNHHFFRSRGLNVILFRGRQRLSGKMDEQVRDLEFAPSESTIFLDPNDHDAPRKKGKEKEKQREEEKNIRLFVVPL